MQKAIPIEDEDVVVDLVLGSRYTADPVLQIRGVSKMFVAYDGARVTALEDVNLEVSEGEFVSIIGPSGCGKSTLLSIVAGLVPAEAGDVHMQGERVTAPNPRLGMVFQEDSTFPWLTALDNVAFGLKVRGVATAERRARAREMLELVGVHGFDRAYPAELSGGMRQRVAIARALVLRPAVLLMDEPFGALDEQTRIMLGEGLLRARDELGQTILFVTHSINEAVQLSDRVVVMTARPGRIRDELAIDLPRPRDTSSLASERFGQLVAQLWGVLRDEATRAFHQLEVAQR
jgi:NitT/TauT family transport system ATP-binding protein